MRPISAFVHLMPDVVGYARSCATRDLYGDRAFAASVSYRARVVGEQRLVTSFDGRQVNSNMTVYLAADIVARAEDQVTLSTGLTGSTELSFIHPTILGAKREPDQTGTHHSVLFLG